jgi:hypothetical protein
MSLPDMRTSLALRQRSVWEAADSGVLLWRENLPYFIPLFALPVWAAAFALRLIPANVRWLSWFLLWWFKPFFDRFALQVVSVRFFRNDGEGGFRSILNGLCGNLFRGLLGDLLWRRFSPLRSAVMPIRVLERAKGKRYQARKNMLRQGGLGFCVFLGIIGLFTEALLLCGEFVFSLAMVNLFLPGLGRSFFDYPGGAEIVVYAVFCFNYMLVESIYVCMGFGLYINCRVEVEGWDLELLFKNFTGKYTAPAAAILLGVLLFAANPLNAEAADENGFPLDGYGVEKEEGEGEPREYFPGGIMSEDSVPYGSLEQILESDDFGGVKEGWAVQFKNEKEPGALPDFYIDFAPWVERLKRVFAYILRTLVVAVIAAAVVTAMVVFYRNRSRGVRRGKGGGPACVYPPVSEGDPDALLEKAAQSFARGCVREAWAACLKGTIAALSRYRNCVFPPDATEYGCLNVVKARSAKDAEGFSGTVRNWVLLAYSGRVPPEGSFEEALRFGRSLKEKGASGA